MDLDTFDLTKIDNVVINIIGKRASGKTTLINEILKIHDVKKQAIIMCNICDNYNYNKINFGFNKQKLSLLYNQQKEDNTEKSVVVLDNVINNLNKNYIEELHYNSRHYNILSINSYTECWNVAFKQQAEYIFVYKTNDYTEKQKLYNHYFYKFFIEYRNFDNVFSSLNPYECLVIKNSSNNCLYRYKVKTNITDCIR